LCACISDSSPLPSLLMELEILDVIFDVSNEVEDIVSDSDKMFNGLYVVIFMLHY
jgi:hypothetical protein